jgi:hypothetical protein
MRWPIGWYGMLFAILLFGGGLFLGSYRFSGDPTHSSAGERLQPAPAGAPASTDGTIVYVPVYSSLYFVAGMGRRTSMSRSLKPSCSVRAVTPASPLRVVDKS